MAIYRKKEGPTWYYAVYVPGRRKRLRGSCGTDNRDEALMVERALKLAVARKSPKERIIRIIDALYDDRQRDDSIPLNAAFYEVRRVMELNNKEVERQTMNHKRRCLARFTEWARREWPRAKNVQDVDRVCAQAFSAYLQKQGLKPKSQFNVTAELGSCWNILKRAHDGIDNPWPLACPIEHRSDRRDAFTDEMVRRIYAAADKIGHQWPLACRLGACTGLRYGDIALLRHEDIVDGAIITDPNKTKRWNIAVCIPLPPDILSMIGTGTGPIMPEHDHCYRTSARLPATFRFSDVLRAAGLDPDKYDFHAFRHYFRTRLSRAGVSADVAKKLGGWIQDETAARYDHHDHRAELEDAINRAWNVG